MKYRINDIARILNIEENFSVDNVIDQLVFDSRKIHSPASSLFFALKSQLRNGHDFIRELYKKGVRNFVVSENIDLSQYPDANFILVNGTLHALQQLASYHRKQFSIPVIGITGSNGKTIVKEWLYQLMQPDHNIVRSPKSYNSQIGVPISIWQMNEQNTLAIFEAGISLPGEMEKLEKIIQPTIGILTNIGPAHSEGFDSFTEKALEKIKLFKHCQKIIYCKDNAAQMDLETEDKGFFSNDVEFFNWSRYTEAWLRVRAIEKNMDGTLIHAQNGGAEFSMQIPFTDDASIENAINCCCTLLSMGISSDTIAARMKNLSAINMRLELKKGMNNCSIINDSYSADLSSLVIALNFLDQQSGTTKKTVILSDFLQSSLDDDQLYEQIFFNIHQHHISRLVGIGERISDAIQEHKQDLNNELTIELYPSTKEFINQFRSYHFREETILIKGARVFAFEQIVQLLEQKVHQTVLEINLNAIAHNLKEYQKQLKPSTKVMAMVKAFAYGSGGAEIAGILQYHKADYLGVAYADEGVELRKAGITLPIMVMNPEQSAFESIVENNLEPEIFSFDMLHAFDSFLQQQGLQQYPVHIEIETGMNRLGFAISDIQKLANELLAISSIKVQTVFSHLASSEEPKQDEFTNEQFIKFKKAAKELEEKVGYDFIRHIANSAATIRHPELQMDMVRLGIGLYGIDNSHSGKLDLQTVATLKSTVAQLKKLRAGESVSYNRQGIVNIDSVIATVRIGYADGYPRRLGNGIGKVGIKGKLFPVIGVVCMDMIMIDVTGINEINEGDEVMIFGKDLSVQQVADWAGTIPYEIMTGISQRVKRVYFEE